MAASRLPHAVLHVHSAHTMKAPSAALSSRYAMYSAAMDLLVARMSSHTSRMPARPMAPAMRYPRVRGFCVAVLAHLLSSSSCAAAAANHKSMRMVMYATLSSIVDAILLQDVPGVYGHAAVTWIRALFARREVPRMVTQEPSVLHTCAA